VKIFVIQRNVATASEDSSLVLVALAGAATLEKFLAHLSLKFNVSVGAAGGCECQQGGPSCIAMRGGGMQTQVGLQVPRPTMDCCPEAHHRDFDPMLVEVETGPVLSFSEPRTKLKFWAFFINMVILLVLLLARIYYTKCC
jgi:hypothetical protein